MKRLVVLVLPHPSPDLLSQSPTAFDEFSMGLCRALLAAHADRLRNYLDTCVGYYTSKWNVVRAAACIMTGT